jgi:lysine 2,3-aminomutase
LSREYPYYDPIYMLPEAGQAWWRSQRPQPRADSAEVVSLANATG